MRNETRLLNTLLYLLRIDAPAKHERPVADYLIKLFRGLDIQLQEDDVGSKIGGNAGNLYVKVKGTIDAEPIILFAHIDTISSTKGLEPVVSEKEICSDGKTVLGGDNRAGAALICELIRFIKENNIEHGPIEIIFTVAEEIGLFGVKNIDHNKIQSRIAFVLDAGGSVGAIVSKAPSLEKISILIKGKSAHAGAEPEKGINAIAIAGKAIAGIKQGRIDSETTLNIGKIQGGEAINIVPEEVFLEGEIRSFNTGVLQNQVELFKKKFQETSNEFGGKVDFNHKLSFSTFNLGKESKPVALAVKAAENLGIDYKITHSGGGSDANILNAHGIDSVGLSIGVFDAHTKNEHILLKDLYTSLDWLIEIVKSVAVE